MVDALNALSTYFVSLCLLRAKCLKGYPYAFFSISASSRSFSSLPVRRLASFGFLLLAGAVASGQAVSATPLDPETAGDLPMVIVISPQWRPLESQQLPFTVDLLSGHDIDLAGSASTADLQRQVPDLSFKTNAVLGQPYLRGVGSDLLSAGADASVATFVDGVYQTRAVASVQDFFDIRRVEVFKGPQGVHLGRNAMGGAISLISNDPVPYNTAEADLSYGSYDQMRLRGMVNVPLLDDSLVLRVAGLLRRRDGYTDNIFLNRTLDDEKLSAVRGKLLVAPAGDLELLLSVESSSRDDARGLGQYPEADPTLGINGGVLLGGVVPDDPRQVTHNLVQSAEVDLHRYSAQLNWSLPGADLLAITAYQETGVAMALDLDATNVDFSTNHPSESADAFTQEFRLTSTGDGDWG